MTTPAELGAGVRCDQTVERIKLTVATVAQANIVPLVGSGLLSDR